MDITPGSVARIIDGEWLNPSDDSIIHTPINDVSTDSRTTRPGDLFWALKGERFDGHDFIENALEKGAVAAVVSRDFAAGHSRMPLIRVKDTLASLQHFAETWRKGHPCPIIAVTGSSGKTTTKELIASILSQRYRCLKTEGNMNNHIGVPLMLLRLTSTHEIAVLELGMNHIGEIAQLTSLVRPACGVITNIGKAHIGFLGSIDNIVAAKAELLDGMGPSDVAILNRDDPFYYILAERCKNGIVTIGKSEEADIRIEKVTLLTEEGKTSVTLRVKDASYMLSIQCLGMSMAYNLAMAIASAMEFHCTREEIEAGVAGFSPLPGRMSHTVIGGIHILDDSYNANPESMHSAMSTLFDCKGSGKAIGIIGDMLELGPQSECLHRQLGQWLAHKKKIDCLITYGPHARLMANEVIKQGYPSKLVWSFNDHEEISQLANTLLHPGDWVLIKGSRMMGLDAVAKRLKDLIGSGSKRKKMDPAHSGAAVNRIV